MKTVILGERPPELTELIERRRRLGLDLHDEVWEGSYHMAPAASARHAYLDQVIAELIGPLARRAGLVVTGEFNLGEPDDFRVPDRGVHRRLPRGVWLDQALMVVEILSLDDETVDKLPFYGNHGVEEVLLVDADARLVRVLRRDGGGYIEAPASEVLGVSVAELTACVDWPE